MSVHLPHWQLVRQQRAAGEPSGAFAERVAQGLGFLQPPVDVFAILSRLGVHLQTAYGTRWSGAVQVQDGAAGIWVRAGEAPVRQRFTAAHELGHLMLHPPGVAFRDDTFSGSPQEAEANDFAAGLLMPRYLLVPYVQRTGTDAKPLSRVFGVSLAAMSLRLYKLGLVSRSSLPPNLANLFGR